MGRLLAGFLLAAIAAGCGQAPASPSATAAAPSATAAAPTVGQSSPITATLAPEATRSARDAGWLADLDALLPAMERLHPDLFHGTPKVALKAAIAALRAGVATASNDELLVGVLRTVALVSARGRDGHTGAFVWGDGTYPVHSLPLRVWLFGDGLYVVDALEPHRDLIGARIASLAGRPIADVLAALDPLIPRDNPATVRLVMPRFLLIPEVLHGAGLVATAGPIEIGVADGRGGRRPGRSRRSAWPTTTPGPGRTGCSSRPIRTCATLRDPRNRCGRSSSKRAARSTFSTTGSK